MRSKLILLPLFLTFLITPATFSANKIRKVYCPKAADLVKDPLQLTWSAERGYFRSYDISFADSIDKFTGAQWSGANVGQITCIYKTFPRTAFPILLIFHTLTLEPQGNAWSKDLGGYKNCNSLDREQCPFSVRIKPKPTDIYQEAERLKSTAPEVPSE